MLEIALHFVHLITEEKSCFQATFQVKQSVKTKNMSKIKEVKINFGQVVIGPPGSGKTTYCNGMQQLMKAIGRECCIVNLDPANEYLPYDCAIDINELVTVEDVMKHMSLGPNGGLLYCMEFLERNQDWLFDKLNASSSRSVALSYLILQACANFFVCF